MGAVLGRQVPANFFLEPWAAAVNQKGGLNMFVLKGLFSGLLAITTVFILAFGVAIPSIAQAQAAKAEAQDQAMKELPKDVDPNSRFRLPLLKREDLDESGKKIMDRITGTKTRVLTSMEGPSGIRLYSPRVAEMHYEISQYLRFQSGLSGTARELAILITAREMDSPFEWAAHEPVGLKEGISQSTIDVIKYRKGVEGLPEMEAVVIQLGRQILGKKKVDSDTFARALKIFGPKQLVDVVALMGYYTSVAALLSTFDMQLDAQQKRYVLPMP